MWNNLVPMVWIYTTYIQDFFTENCLEESVLGKTLTKITGGFLEDLPTLWVVRLIMLP